MADNTARLGNNLVEHGFHLVDALHAIMEEKDLAASFQLSAYRVTNDAFVVTVDGGVDGDFSGEGSINGRHVPCSH